MNFRTWLKLKVCITLSVFTFGLLHESYVRAQALPVQPAANFVMNRAVGTIISRAAVTRGFAANDPRIATTMTAVSGQLTSVNTASTVVGVGLAIAGAPMWIGIAASLGVLAIGTALVVGNTSFNILPGMPNRLELIGPPPSMPAYVPPAQNMATSKWSAVIAAGYALYKSTSCPSSNECWLLPSVPSGDGYVWGEGNVAVKTTNEADFGRAVAILTKPDLNYAYMASVGTTYTWEYSDVLKGTDFGGNTTYTLRIREARQGGDAVGLPSYDRLMTYPLFPPGNIGRSVGDSLQAVYPNITSGMANQPVSPDTLARITDKAWRDAAAQPGYQGLPYSMTQPITAAEVQPWAVADPLAVPKLSDLLTPANNPSAQAVPISPTVQPSTNTGTDPGTNPTPTTNPNVNVVNTPNVNIANTPNVNVVNRVQIDPGSFPTVSEPDPVAPTAWSIFYPFKFIADQAKASINVAAGECPRPTFHVFGKDVTMESQCTITENNRAALSAVMVAVYSIAALVIILSA